MIKFVTRRDKDGTIRGFEGDNGDNLGTYETNDKNIKSFGGKIGNVGGTVGLDKGKPFGSMNYKGKIFAQFGPQGDESPKKRKKSAVAQALQRMKK